MFDELFAFTILPARVAEWNRLRDNLNFDPKLEIRMLCEEIFEFYKAESLIERLQEFADIAFVWYGTEAKFSCNQYESGEHLSINVKNFETLEDWINNEAYRAYRNLSAELDDTFDMNEDQINALIRACLQAVIDCNDLKPTERVDGKIIKGDKYVSPVFRIKGLIREYSKSAN